MDLTTILIIAAVVIFALYLYVRSQRKAKERKYRDL